MNMQGSAFLKFLTYNNAVPIAISLTLLGAGGAFAATDPQAIYSANQQVVSIDNTYLVNKDLSNYQPKIEVTGVTEDPDNYYVAYDLYTIDLQNYVWQDVVRPDTMQVSKADLGPYRDLGVYVTQKMKDIVSREYDRLIATQTDARTHVSQKVVATQYGGLVGKFLDPTTDVLPGYTPVVQPPPPPQESETAAAGASQSGSSQASGTNTTPSGSSGSAEIGLQLLGNDPAVISLHTAYVDLGAVLIDPRNTNVGVHVFQNGTEVTTPTVDTSTSSVQTIEYRATDPNGVLVVVRRIVLVGGATDPGGEIPTAGYTSAPPVQASPNSTQQSAPPIQPSAPTTNANDTSSSSSSAAAPQSQGSSTPIDTSSTSSSTIDVATSSSSSASTTQDTTQNADTSNVATSSVQTAPAQDGSASSTSATSTGQ